MQKMSNNSWHLHKNLNEFVGQPKRMKHTMIYYNNSLLLYGGRNSKDEALSDILRYDLNDSSWQRLVCVGTPPSARFEHTCVLYEKDLIIFGGKHESRQLNDLFKYNIPKVQWNRIEPTNNNRQIPGPRCAHNAAVSMSFMYIVGGFGHHILQSLNDLEQHDNKQVRLNDMWRLDLSNPGNYKWISVEQNGNKPPPNCNSSMTVYENYLYLLPGAAAENAYELFGFNVNDECWTKLMYSSIFSDLVIGKRVGHTLTASNDGQLWLFGGNDDKKLYRFDINDPYWSVFHSNNSRLKPSGAAYHGAAINGTTLFVYGGVESANDVDSQKLSGQLYSITIVASKSTFIPDMKQLLKESSFSDLVIVVGNDNKQFKCHSSIIIGRSSVLAEMILGKLENKCNGSKELSISLPDVKPIIFEKILQYIYTDMVTPEKDCELNDLQLFMELYMHAFKLKLPKLKTCSLKYLISSVNCNRLISLLQFADVNGIDCLKDSCMNFMRKTNNYKDVIVKKQIEELSKCLLLQIARLPAESNDDYDSIPKLFESFKFNSIKDEFNRLLNSCQGSDVYVTFDNFSVKAHKAILCARSDYFTAQCRSFPVDEISVKFKGENAPRDVLTQLLKFIYTDSIDAELEVAVYLLGTSEYFLLHNDRLDMLAMNIIEKNLNVDCVIDILLAAHDINHQPLIKKCIFIIAKNYKKFNERQKQFLRIPKILLISIMECVNEHSTIHWNTESPFEEV